MGWGRVEGDRHTDKQKEELTETDINGDSKKPKIKSRLIEEFGEMPQAQV